MHLLSCRVVGVITMLAAANPAASASEEPRYRAVLLPYEHGVLDGAESVAAAAAATLAQFHALAPPYARLLHAVSRGLPLSWQVTELFPRHPLNPVLVRELQRRCGDALATARVAPGLTRLLAVASKHQIAIQVYTTLDPAWARADMTARKLDLPVVPVPPAGATGPIFPPVEAVRAKLEISSARLLLVGGTRQACVTAGINGMDFALVGELADAPVTNDPPCRVTRRLRGLDDLASLLARRR